MKKILIKFNCLLLIIFVILSYKSTVCADDVDNEDFFDTNIEVKLNEILTNGDKKDDSQGSYVTVWTYFW